MTSVSLITGGTQFKISQPQVKWVTLCNCKEWNNRPDITAAGSEIEVVVEFCHSSSYVNNNGSCNRDTRVQISKASGVFGKMRKIIIIIIFVYLWRDRTHDCKPKMNQNLERLYEAVVLSMLVCSGELWPLTSPRWRTTSYMAVERP